MRSQGLRSWFWQRLTSVYIALFLIITLIWYLGSGTLGFAEWRGVMANPVVNIASALFILAVLYHASVGVRDILVDYVHPLWLRSSLLIIVYVILLSLAIWSMMILNSVVML
jgi:succinate dehydrogenase / fumarate reductase membrane anchor subunit